MTMDNLKSYLMKETKEPALTDSTELIESKLLDSLQLIQLIAFLEKEFAVSIPPQELDPNNFKNVQSMKTMIDKLKR